MATQRRLRAVPETGNRAALYVRVSSVAGRTEEEFHSPALQVKAMRDVIGRRGLVEVDVVEDIDVSGRTFQREGIRRVFDLAKDRRIDVVALYDLSRLGRNTAESLRTIAELRELGVTIVSTVEQIDDTPEGQFQLGVFLGMAQLYSDQISRRWRQVAAHRAEQGYAHGGTPPLGYRRDGRTMQPDPALAGHVQDVFRRYAAGERIWHITQRWNAATGRRTTYTVVRRMLDNPVYVGKVTLNGQVLPGRHEPLVSEVTWRRVRRRREEESRTPARRLAIANPLAGLAVCDSCSRPLQMHFGMNRKVGGGSSLECRGAREFHDCAGVGVPLIDEVEAFLLDEIERVAADLKLDMAARAEQRSRATRARVDVGRLKRELSKLESARGRAAADYARRETTLEEYRGAVEVLREETDRIRRQVAEAERTVRSATPEALIRLAEGLRKRWPRMTAEDKHRVLKPSVAQIRVRRAAYYRQPVAERVEVVFL